MKKVISGICTLVLALASSLIGPTRADTPAVIPALTSETRADNSGSLDVGSKPFVLGEMLKGRPDGTFLVFATIQCGDATGGIANRMQFAQFLVTKTGKQIDIALMSERKTPGNRFDVKDDPAVITAYWQGERHVEIVIARLGEKK